MTWGNAGQARILLEQTLNLVDTAVAREAFGQTQELVAMAAKIACKARDKALREQAFSVSSVPLCFILLEENGSSRPSSKKLPAGTPSMFATKRQGIASESRSRFA